MKPHNIHLSQHLISINLYCLWLVNNLWEYLGLNDDSHLSAVYLPPYFKDGGAMHKRHDKLQSSILQRNHIIYSLLPEITGSASLNVVVLPLLHQYLTIHPRIVMIHEGFSDTKSLP